MTVSEIKNRVEGISLCLFMGEGKIMIINLLSSYICLKLEEYLSRSVREGNRHMVWREPWPRDETQEPTPWSQRPGHQGGKDFLGKTVSVEDRLMYRIRISGNITVPPGGPKYELD